MAYTPPALGLHPTASDMAREALIAASQLAPDRIQ